MDYLEHLIILGLFLLSIRYLVGLFSNKKEAGCSKNCGNSCAVTKLEKAMEKLEKEGLMKP